MSARKGDRSSVRPQSDKPTRGLGRLATVPVMIITGCFTLLGITKLVPALGMFGLIWTLGAGGMFAFGLFRLNRKPEDSEEAVPEDRVDMEDGTTVLFNEPMAAHSGNTQRRLMELDSLLHSGLVTMEEYEAKRKSILDEL